MKDLSIIIPHYNSPKLLSILLLSIPIKNNIEIIVVDDKSDEELEEFILLKNNENFQHVTFLENTTKIKGAGVCRNIGLQSANGKWVIFADSDDFFMENIYDKISKYFNSNYEVVFFKPTSINLNNRLETDRHKPYERLVNNYLITANAKTEIQLRYLFFVPWSKLIRKEFIKKNKIYFDEVLASNDVMFSTKIGYYMQRFNVDSNVIYCVTRSDGTLTTTVSPQIFNARLDAYINYNNFIHGYLSGKDIDAIPINGLNLLIDSIKYRLGFKQTYKTFLKLKKNKVPIIDKRFINPLFIISKWKSIVRKKG